MMQLFFWIFRTIFRVSDRSDILLLVPLGRTKDTAKGTTRGCTYVF